MNIEITKLKYYNIWNSQIYRLGSIMLGSQPLRFITTLIIILLPNVLYIFVVNFENQLFYLLLIELLIILLLPGHYYQKFNYEKQKELFQIPQLKLVPTISRPSSQLLVSNTFSFQSKYCPSCNIYRPPRTSHCYECNNCILNFDHHCPWIGQCIAHRNYKFYYGFVFFGLINQITLFIFCIIQMSNSNLENYQDYITILIILYTLPLNLFFCYLFILHTYLIYTCQSTKEYIKREWSTNVGNPFKQQFWKKIKSIIILKQPTFINYDISYYRLSPTQTLEISNDKQNASYNQLQIYPITNAEQNEVVEMIVVK